MKNIEGKPVYLRENTMVAQYFVTTLNPPKGIIVLFDGLPALPTRDDTIHTLMSEGYNVLFPRYTGTWESDGVFLEQDPSVDVQKNLPGLLSQITAKKSESLPLIYIGSSFGGNIALHVAEHIAPQHLILLSPVLSFARVKEIETLGEYLKTYFPGAYRFSSEKWEKLISDKLLTPNPTVKKQLCKRTLIIAGVNDTQINHSDLEKYAESKDIHFSSVNCGHISLRKLDKEVLQLIRRHLRRTCRVM